MPNENIKYNVFLTNSPFQLICAIEAVHQFHCDNNILIVRYSSNANNNDQIRSLIMRYKLWSEIHEIPYRYHEFVGFYKYLKVVKQFSIINSVSKVFIGEFRSFEMHLVYNNLHPDNVFLLDDGTMTLKVQNDFIPNIKHYFFESKWKYFIKLGIVKFFKLRWYSIRIPHLFTFFNLEPNSVKQLVINNDFGFLKEHFNNKSKLTNKVFFIGSPIVEDEIINDDVFFNLLSKIDKFYLKNGLKLIYISHRRENLNKLVRIENLLKNNVKRFNIPLEIVLLESKELPRICCSFFSTALFTINSIFKNIEAVSFRINLSVVSLQNRSRVKLFYENMKKNKIIIKEDY